MIIFVEKYLKMRYIQNCSDTKQPLTLGLTGLIGSGKSTVATGFQALGVPIYNCDNRAKILMRDKLADRISELLGVKIIGENGELDIISIANRIFSNCELLNKINAIVHPEVLKDFLKWRKKQTTAQYCIIESAILYGSIVESCTDKVVAVVAPKEICVERAAKRDNSDRKAVENRMNNQLSERELREKADFVIDTTKLIMPQIIKINTKLSE